MPFLNRQKRKFDLKTTIRKLKKKSEFSMRTKNYFGTIEAHSEKHKGKIELLDT